MYLLGVVLLMVAMAMMYFDEPILGTPRVPGWYILLVGVIMALGLYDILAYPYPFL